MEHQHRDVLPHSTRPRRHRNGREEGGQMVRQHRTDAGTRTDPLPLQLGNRLATTHQTLWRTPSLCSVRIPASGLRPLLPLQIRRRKREIPLVKKARNQERQQRRQPSLVPRRDGFRGIAPDFPEQGPSAGNRDDGRGERSLPYIRGLGLSCSGREKRRYFTRKGTKCANWAKTPSLTTYSAVERVRAEPAVQIPGTLDRVRACGRRRANSGL